MEQKLSCEIVRDLLPSYAEGLTSEVTNSALQAHLESCQSCRQVLADMREPERKNTTAEIDYLKTVRRLTNCKIALSVLGAAIAIALLICIWIFAIGPRRPICSIIRLRWMERASI